MPLPPATGRRSASHGPIHRLEPENVAEKCAVRFGVFTVDNYVSAKNHFPLQRNPYGRFRLLIRHYSTTLRSAPEIGTLSQDLYGVWLRACGSLRPSKNKLLRCPK